MWRKFLATVSCCLLLLLGAGTALASDPGVGTRVEMIGEVTIGRSQQQVRLLLTANAADNSGWHLEAALIPSSARRSGRNGEREPGRRRGGGGVTDLSGQFILAGPGRSEITGQATGQLDQYGAGSLELINSVDGSPLDATFSVDGGGQLQLDLSGQSLQDLNSGEASAGPSQPVDHTFWYVSRAAGLTAYLLLFINVCLGLGISTSILDALLARWRVLDLHEFTGLLALGFVALHMFVLLGDRYTGFTLAQVLLPFTSSYRPFWTSVGVFALYLTVVVVVSFYSRRRIGQRAWRICHYVSYCAFVMAFGHSVLAGTDTSQLWAALLYWVTGIIVVILTLWRMSNPSARRLIVSGAEHPVQS